MPPDLVCSTLRAPTFLSLPTPSLYALDEFVLRYQIATFYFTKSLAPTETRITPQGEKQIAFHSTFEMACILD